LEQHRDEIVSGQLVVFFQDECHLLWGDLCGYVWGKTSERIEVPMSNERQKQTYYGALNLATQTFWLEGYEKGNSESTLAFLKSLQAQHPGCRIAMIWDGASHHRSGAVKDYLAEVNQDLEESKWKLTCLRFAPNDPQQNPVEDVWLQAKRFIREFYHLCKSFGAVKWLFEFATHCQIFRFPKVFMYGSFSRIT
jgi:transposase